MYFTSEIRNLIFFLFHCLLPSLKSELKHGGEIQKKKNLMKGLWQVKTTKGPPSEF